MNNEKQHSEYKIIETVATPTFDGISVETHPEDQLGGEQPPKNILKDGNYKYDISQGAKQAFAAYNVKSGRVFVLANSLGGTNNLNLYNANGAVIGREGSDTYMQAIKDVCSTYDNFVEVTKEVNHEVLLADFENYVEL